MPPPEGRTGDRHPHKILFFLDNPRATSVFFQKCADAVSRTSERPVKRPRVVPPCPV